MDITEMTKCQKGGQVMKRDNLRIGDVVVQRDGALGFCFEIGGTVYILYQDGGYEAFEVTSNHAGGILGGMSDGAEIVIRAYFKPTPSIAKPQKTANENGDNITLSIKGRHDPTVVERANVVVECMVAITILDALLENMGARMDYLKEIYPNE
jgi:chorismate synthase